MIDELSLQLINEQNEFFFQLKKIIKASVKRFNSIKSIQDYIEKNKRQNKWEKQTSETSCSINHAKIYDSVRLFG